VKSFLTRMAYKFRKKSSAATLTDALDRTSTTSPTRALADRFVPARRRQTWEDREDAIENDVEVDAGGFESSETRINKDERG